MSASWRPEPFVYFKHQVPPVTMRIASAILFVSGLLLQAPDVRAQSGRIPVAAEDGMVVTSHHLASEAGTHILRLGGNAVDAAIATAFALAVTLPSAGNIGGGGFLVYHGADGYVTTFNFREKAPLLATPNMFLDESGKVRDNSNHLGPLSVGVPGTVAGLFLAHQSLGAMDWADLLKPAIRLAEDGFPSSRAMQGFMRRLGRMDDPLYDGAKASFLKADGAAYAPGEIWKQPDLAASLRRIRDEGHDGFYRGETARLLAKFFQRHDGLITEADLAAYQAEERAPVHGAYRGYDVYAMAPPSSGGVALIEMLNMLEGFDLRGMGHNSAAYLHVLTEVMRRAYADRAEHLGDPNFNLDMPLERLLSKSYADGLRESINMEEASVSDSSSFADVYTAQESEETTHLSVMDAEGNAVSLTYTLEFSYGSGIVADGAGFLLNNEMGDFNPVPGHTDTQGRIGTPPNLVAPEKRMLSSMTPTIVAHESKPVIVVGSPGGRTIINTVLQVILNVIDHEMNIGEAVEAPRIHHQWLPNVSSFETLGISPDTRRLYEAMGHTVRNRSTQGQAHCIAAQGALLYGAADTRSYDGRAVGY